MSFKRLVDPYNTDILIPGFIYVKNGGVRAKVRSSRYWALRHFLRAFRHPAEPASFAIEESKRTAAEFKKLQTAASRVTRTFLFSYIVPRWTNPTPVPRSDSDKSLILSSRRPNETANAGAMFGVPDLRPYVEYPFNGGDEYTRAWVDWFNFLSCPQTLYASLIHRSSVQSFNPPLSILARGPTSEEPIDIGVDDCDTLLMEVEDAWNLEPVLKRTRGGPVVKPLPEDLVTWIDRLDKDKKLADFTNGELFNALDYLSYVKRLNLQREGDADPMVANRAIPMSGKIRAAHLQHELKNITYATAHGLYKSCLAAFNSRPYLKKQGYTSPLNRGKEYIPRGEALEEDAMVREMVANESKN